MGAAALLFLAGNAAAFEIRVVTEIWPPFRVGNPDRPETLSGIDIELLDRIAPRLGLTYRVRRLPWARCLAFMRSGRADLITGLAHTPERAEFIRYSALPYHTVSPAFYVQKGMGNRIQTYLDLQPFSIGYSLKSAYFQPFDSDETLNKVGVSTEKQLIRMLSLGRLDIIIGTNANVEYDIGVMGLRSQIERTAYQPPRHTDLYVGISRKSPLTSRADEIDQILRHIVRNGRLLPVLETYFVSASPAAGAGEASGETISSAGKAPRQP
jgi:polar amino acid transport system substrate-binding protein